MLSKICGFSMLCLLAGFVILTPLGLQVIFRQHDMMKRCEPTKSNPDQYAACAKNAFDDVRKMKVFE